jgi:hypothetical protein
MTELLDIRGELGMDGKTSSGKLLNIQSKLDSRVGSSKKLNVAGSANILE